MACRDYDYDYEVWLKRSTEHFDKMTAMLRQLCEVAKKQSLDLPRPVAQWWVEPPAGKDFSLSKEVFDNTAQMLCQMCRVMEEKSVAMPSSVAAWWAEHKARDGQPEDLGKGLSPTPTFASFWAEHAAKEPAQVQGINHLDAVKALEKAGFRVLRKGKYIVLANDTRQLIIPRHDPVNGYTMAGLIALAGLKEEDFRKLLMDG